MPKEAGKSAVIKMKMKAPKKNSVLFESGDPNSLFQSVYMMRDGAKKLLGVDDLDKVTEIEMTVKVL
jgi:hypothetical protein